jgi:hypothetical protein
VVALQHLDADAALREAEILHRLLRRGEAGGPRGGTIGAREIGEHADADHLVLRAGARGGDERGAGGAPYPGRTAMALRCDLIIRDATIFDGTGGPRRAAMWA